MHIVGIVAEYNPFHNGHAYQIKKARELTGCDAVVIAMSGDFVQRGTPAIIDKALRTKMALSNGADVVLQMPVCYSTASAEAFAYGSVALLTAAGIDTLAFGCETQNESLLYELADLYTQQPADFRHILADALKEGMTFPAARSKATIAYYQNHVLNSTAFQTAFTCADDIEQFLLQPNNILGIEYIKALSRLEKEGLLSHPIKTLAIPRIGSDHHSLKKEGSICSASAIRQTVYKKKDSFVGSDYSDYIPENCHSIFDEYISTHPAMHEDDFSPQLGYCLLQNKNQGFTSYMDVTRDISNRILNRITEYKGFSQFCRLLQTKECTYSRISRLLLHILLQITGQHADQLNKHPVPYIRVLGFRKESAQLLSHISERDTAPLITNVKNAVELLSMDSYEIFIRDLFARDLYLMNASVPDLENDYQILIRL